MTEPPASSEQELKRIIQYLAQIYQTQKKMGEQITALSQSVAGLQASGGSDQTTQQLSQQIAAMNQQIAALNQRLTQLQGSTPEAGGGLTEEKMIPLLQHLIESLDGRIRKILAEMIIPEITAPAATPEAVPALAPAATSPGASPSPAATSPGDIRRPSDIPDHRVASVVESLQDVIVQLRRREKMPKEFMLELLEQARDNTMNNLASRAVAAGVFKEIITLTKSSPVDVPKQTVDLILEKLDGLVFHIRKSQ
ncbi:MAG: hypothetical protein ACFFCO_13430 [Promethearchaeota archaeon]